MLQQTRVATVIPYYRRFLRVFPSVERLAQAPLEKVLEVWSGMGYYRRARDLHRAARVVTRDFAGRFPDAYREARRLPGVGDYTARAVLSIAYGQPYAVLDGNVARVVARLRSLRGGFGRPGFRRAVERELATLLSPKDPGGFNQAVMELGQTVCLPHAPLCPRCPLRTGCRAYAAGKPESFPAPRKRRASELHHLAAAVLERSGRLALVRGLEEGLLAGLWNFPSAFGPSRALALRRLRERLQNVTRAEVRLGRPLGSLRHRITHRDIRVQIYPSRASRSPGADSLHWFRPEELSRTAVSQLARKIARQLPKS